ncbi:MAG: cysteine--tRNA ligase, partial [Opitutales bacterium]|nr:cysteine--tRNA ligase [Opitutales bacterium]
MTPSAYNTISRQKEPLLPAREGAAFGMYCCGPTVYGPAHIGNFRTFAVQDVLRRTLEAAGIKVRHVRNITDVDDKTIRESRKLAMSLKDFTKKWEDKFHDDCKRLNLLPPTVEPRATEHIKEQLDMVSTLVEKGHAYAAKDGSVYFRISSFENYGKLSGLDREHLATQSVNSAGDANIADEYERDSVSDFALWKGRKPEDGENFGKSPWGEGRPGW